MKKKRIESIDILRGIVMIIMALDHVRDYFHRDAFIYEPTDLSRTTLLLFFTRWITHFCAPVFVFLAGISACLYGANKTRAALSHYLFTRGVWLVFVELVIISFGKTFNPSFGMFNLQVIWAIGISMIVLSGLVYWKKQWILMTGIVLIAGHNLLDKVVFPGRGLTAFLWSLLHEQGDFVFGYFTILVHYPVLPWIGIILLGYCVGGLYVAEYDAAKRIKILFCTGFAFIFSFLFLRIFNIYGDSAHWQEQKNAVFSLLSLLNVTKYPPSLLYILITLGPAMVFLSLAERPLNRITQKISVFGRVPFFYYVVHFYIIHLLAVIGAVISGYSWTDMILSDRINRVAALKGYGFHLMTVYMIWIGLVLFMYPFCKWFDRYKRTHQASKRWLSYI